MMNFNQALLIREKVNNVKNIYYPMARIVFLFRFFRQDESNWFDCASLAKCTSEMRADTRRILIHRFLSLRRFLRLCGFRLPSSQWISIETERESINAPSGTNANRCIGALARLHYSTGYSRLKCVDFVRRRCRANGWMELSGIAR